MIDFLMLLACVLTRLFRSRARLEAEILVLRHQLNILQRKSTKRTAFKSIDRVIFAGLYRFVPGVLGDLKILNRKGCLIDRNQRHPTPSTAAREVAQWRRLED